VSLSQVINGLNITARWYGQEAVVAPARPETGPGSLLRSCPGGPATMAQFLQIPIKGKKLSRQGITEEVLNPGRWTRVFSSTVIFLEQESRIK